MSLLGIKAKLIGAGLALMTFLAFILRHKQVVKQRDKARENYKRADAQAKESKKIVESDAEIEKEFSELEQEAKKDVKDGKMPDNIRDRNKF